MSLGQVSTSTTMETTDPTILKPSGNEQIPSIGPVSGEPPTLGVTSSPTASGGHLQPSPTTIESPTPVLPSSKVAPASQSPPANEKSEGPIKYRVEFINIFGSVIYQHDMEGPHFESRSPPTKNHAFTIVTTFRTAKEHFVEGEELSGTSPTKTMHISSKAIEQALRSVVKYYPSQDLASDVIKIQYPYAVLVHHYDELMEYRERFNPEKFLDASKVCFREKDAYEHLGVLKDFLDQEIMPLVEEEKARNRRGQATFDMLWLIKQPGKAFICYLGSDKEKIAGVIHSVDMGSFVNPTRSWTINYWNLNYGGDTIGRQLSNYLENKYTGERDIDDIVDLDVYPHSLMVHEAIQSGKTFWNLLQKQCKHYKGRTTTYPHNEVDGLVMCDLDAFYTSSPAVIPGLIETTTDIRTWVSDCICSVCSERRDANAGTKSHIFEDFQMIFVDGRELQDHQYMLMPSSIHAYVFRTRTWENLSVTGFSEPKYEAEMINNLVMNPKRVEMLKALAKSFARVNIHGELSKREPWSADFVKGKGNGLIFLLHGKPGVGKTCTAECIAAYTSRPLMVLTSSDIGTFPQEVETNLTDHFKRARRWGAVLLIDEADVFMERRSTADLTRNSLVAGFLRALEFYDGILFLTTNRVGSFDDAFISRIHVHLYYPDFDDESRAKVWKTFIDKLERERGDYIRLTLKAEEYIEGEELKAVKWNGREIRNAFQTAVALAEYESTKDKEGKIVLTEKHLKSVVEMSRDFKEYLNELHLGDEGKRAERRHERLNI